MRTFTLALLAALGLCNGAIAQNVGVGNATPQARLDVNGGVAVAPTAAAAAAAINVPTANLSALRITATAGVQANTINLVGAPAEGQLLTVFNQDGDPATLAGLSIPAGGTADFIFLNGAWRKRGEFPGTAGWGLTGNAGTVAGTNFVGTTDAAEFDVRTNNLIRTRFTNTGAILMANPAVAGNTVVGNTPAALPALTGGSNTVFGTNAAASLTTGTQNTALGQQALTFNVAGVGNTAVGRVAMNNGATGSYNTAVGAFSLLNTATSYNTAVGYAAAQTATTGGDNVAVGDFTLSSTTTGSGNTALGSEAGLSNTTGSLNTFVGNLANVGSGTLTNATAVGALAQVDASNALVLGSVAGVNGATNTVNVGIGVNAPATRLHINGAYANNHTLVAAAAAPPVPNNVSHVRLTAVPGVQANAVVGPGAPVEGQKLTIVNEDDNNASFAGATIVANGGVATFIRANGVWRLESNSATAGWGLTGNTGTVMGTNFLGTIDAQGLDLRTANTIRGRIDAAGLAYFSPNVGGFAAPAGGFTQLNVQGSTYIPNGASYWIGNTADAADRLRMHLAAPNAYIDFASGDLFFRRGTTQMVHFANTGRVGMGANSTANDHLYVQRDPAVFGANRTTIYGYRPGSSVAANGGTGWGIGAVDAAVKGYSFWGNQYTAGVAGYNFLDYANSAALVGARYDGSAMGAFGYNDGLGFHALYLNGNFWNQETEWGQSMAPFVPNTFLLRTINITTHGTGTNGSVVVVSGQMDYYKTGSATYVAMMLYRDGVKIYENSQYSAINQDNMLSVQWLDEPGPGAHTYQLYCQYPSGGLTFYGNSLQAIEIKR